MKKCTKCGQIKDFVEFYRRGRWSKKPTEQNRYRSSCKSCCLDCSKERFKKTYDSASPCGLLRT